MSKNKLHDSLKFREQVAFDGVEAISSGHTSGRMIGELTAEEFDEFGNLMFSQVEYNDIVIGGSTFILEQMFKVSSARRFNITGSGVPTTNGAIVLGNEKIFGFIVGAGGEDGNGIQTVNYVDTTPSLSSAVGWIPIRKLVNNSDNAATIASLKTAYKLFKVDSSDYANFYAKSFDTDPTINHVMVNGSAFPASLAATDQVVTYSESICNLTVDDIREHYLTSSASSIEGSGINSLGLVAGCPVNAASATTDYFDIRLVTAVNFKKRLLDNNLNTLKITYRVYCI